MSENTRPLWEEIFSEDSASFLDYYYSVKTRDNWIQTDTEDGKLISMIHWNPYPLWIRGRRVDSRYLIAVATRKEYRHQGRMARLLWEGLKHFAAQGMPLVWLMPADPAIYEPFSFRYIYDKIEGNWPITSGATVSAQEETTLTVGILPPEQYPQAAAFLQEELSRRYEMFAERSCEYLRVLEAEASSEGGHVMGIYERGLLVGVFSFWLGDAVEIRELVVRPSYETGAGREALIYAVNRYLQPWGLPVTAITTGWLGTPKPIIMARLVSLKAFMPIFTADEPLELCLQITDPILPENQGTFRWQLGPEGSKWEPAERGACPEHSFTIAELTEWLFGGIAADYPQIRPMKDIFLNEIV